MGAPQVRLPEVRGHRRRRERVAVPRGVAGRGRAAAVGAAQPETDGLPPLQLAAAGAGRGCRVRAALHRGRCHVLTTSTLTTPLTWLNYMDMRLYERRHYRTGLLLQRRVV